MTLDRQNSDEQYKDLSDEERYDIAIELTQQAQDCGDDPESYNRAADMLKQALAVMNGDEAFERNYVEYCTEIAYFHMQDGNYHKAIAFFKRLQPYIGTDAQMLLDLGVCHAQNNAVLPALRAWQDAVSHIDEDNAGDREILQEIAQNLRIIAKSLGATLTIKDTYTSVSQAVSRLFIDERKAKKKRE